MSSRLTPITFSVICVRLFAMMLSTFVQQFNSRIKQNLNLHSRKQ